MTDHLIDLEVLDRVHAARVVLEAVEQGRFLPDPELLQSVGRIIGWSAKLAEIAGEDAR